MLVRAYALVMNYTAEVSQCRVNEHAERTQVTGTAKPFFSSHITGLQATLVAGNDDQRWSVPLYLALLL
jgi:hypothetical protein